MMIPAPSLCLSMLLTVTRDYRLFIVVEFLGKSVCIAEFNQYCARGRNEKMKCDRYWRQLLKSQEPSIGNPVIID